MWTDLASPHDPRVFPIVLLMARPNPMPEGFVVNTRRYAIMVTMVIPAPVCLNRQQDGRSLLILVGQPSCRSFGSSRALIAIDCIPDHVQKPLLYCVASASTCHDYLRNSVVTDTWLACNSGSARRSACRARSSTTLSPITCRVLKIVRRKLEIRHSLLRVASMSSRYATSSSMGG